MGYREDLIKKQTWEWRRRQPIDFNDPAFLESRRRTNAMNYAAALKGGEAARERERVQQAKQAAARRAAGTPGDRLRRLRAEKRSNPDKDKWGRSLRLIDSQTGADEVAERREADRKRMYEALLPGVKYIPLSESGGGQMAPAMKPLGFASRRPGQSAARRVKGEEGRVKMGGQRQGVGQGASPVLGGQRPVAGQRPGGGGQGGFQPSGQMAGMGGQGGFNWVSPSRRVSSVWI